MEIEEIKQSILSLVGDDENLDKIKEEIDTMASVEGLDGKPILFKFYDVYKKHGHKTGEENKINSWTAVALGMTSKEPDGEFLPKRRAFARAGFPDIDSDFDYARRQEVYDYIIDKYGRENVGNIGTYGALKMKSFVRRAFRAIDPDNVWQPTPKGKEQWITHSRLKGDEIVKSLPTQFGAVLKVKHDGEEHAIKTTEDAYRYCRNFASYIDKYPDLLTHSRNIEGLLSTFGVHAAGIVISDCPLDEIAPLRQTSIIKDTLDGGEKVFEYATQFENADLEEMGLIKFDILALSTLTVMSKCIQLIEENCGFKLDITEIPLDDEKTFDLYRQGKLVGVFQCEEPGMQRTMQQMGVDRFDDIMAGVALYRPGPMESIPSYCARKHGSERVEYFHESIEPFVKPYLERTYGLLVYQEQIMQICNSLAGFSISDGYVIIKAIGKKKEKLLVKYRAQFIDGCVSNGISKGLATDYWDKFITPFALYGFNASHSCCYGFLSYQTAYLKANFPEEFMTAYLNVELDRAKHEKVQHLEQECKAMGIEILRRSINSANWDYEIVQKKGNGVQVSQIQPAIRCKALPSHAAKNILENRPYKDMRDFAFRTDSKQVDTKAVEALALANFFAPHGKTVDNTPPSERVKKFSILREDRKKASRKGVVSQDLFS
tara:strand:+ start:57177 stop:59156 length:1980 start_codon:yes stop_codon:yes gene_type:complete